MQPSAQPLEGCQSFYYLYIVKILNIETSRSQFAFNLKMEKQYVVGLFRQASLKSGIWVSEFRHRFSLTCNELSSMRLHELNSHSHHISSAMARRGRQ